MKAIALCIGVDQYEDRDIAGLHCAHRDAHAMANVLQRLGFEAEALMPRDMTVDGVYRRLRAAGERLTGADDLLLFYFAGHGKTLQQGEGGDQLLLMPTASLRSLGLAGAPGTLSYQTLKAETDHLPGQRVFVLDACRLPLAAREMAHRDGSNTARFEGERVFRGPGLSTRQFSGGRGLSVLNSCSDGERAEELPDYPGGGHGIFTAALVEWLEEAARQGEASLSEAVVRQDLHPRLGQLAARYRQSEASQRPTWFGPPVRLKLRPTPASEPSRPGNGAALDERLWKLACLKDKVEAYEAYLRESEICAHEGEALERIAGLLAEQAKGGEPEGEEAILPEPLVQKGGLPGGGAKPGVATPERFVPEVKALKPLDTFCDLPEGPAMVLLPQGMFLMGSPLGEEGRSADEGPQHEVRIAYKLAVGKYAVTFAEWDACVAAGGTSHVPGDEGWGRGRRPVINVSWEDAQAYLRWLNGQLGLGEADPHRYRLLSEAEWEYACRAGTTGPFNFEGQISPAKVNYDSNSSYGGSVKDASGYRKRTVEVGSLPGNRWGLHEMHGNVWEWVEDCWNGNYKGAPDDGSAWRSGDCEERVLRGGSWYGTPWDARAALRFRNTATLRDDDVGFRVARMLP